MEENLKRGRGAIHQPFFSSLKRLFNKKWHQVAGDSAPYDWTIPYIQPILPIEDQGTSEACGAFATCYGYELINGSKESRKDCYSQVAYPGGGTTVSALNNLWTGKGVCNDSLIASYKPDGTCDEPFMLERLQTPYTSQEALLHHLGASVPVSLDIDSVAQAIRDNKWVLITLRGQNGNNPSWDTEFPSIPSNLNTEPIWEHFVAGMAMMYITPTEFKGVQDGIITFSDLQQKYHI